MSMALGLESGVVQRARPPGSASDPPARRPTSAFRGDIERQTALP